MWTVTVTLPDGGKETFSDSRRTIADAEYKSAHGRFAWAYLYVVDESSDALRVFRRGQRYNWQTGWDSEGNNEEVGYYRSHQWERVRGD
jgi:hypothetical protein